MADTDSKDDTGDEVGRFWREWVSAHRKQVKLTVWLLVVALAGTLVLVWTLQPGPKDLVTDYLDAIQDGDTDAALAIAGKPDAKEPFLSTAALDGDWTVDAVVERHRGGGDAYVDFTISTGNTSEQGRFHVTRTNEPDEKDGWRIEEPFVKVELETGGLGFVELGDVRHEAGVVGETGTYSALLFPGAYKLYPSLAKRATFDPGKLVVVPTSYPTGSSPDQAAELTLTEAGAREAQRAINTFVDNCAKKSDASPDGCPFSASAEIGVLDDVMDLTWKVVAHPEARFVTGPGGLDAIVRKSGTMTLTATVTRDGGPPATVTRTCEFGFVNMSFDLTMKGFAVGGVPEEDRSTSSTECF